MNMIPYVISVVILVHLFLVCVFERGFGGPLFFVRHLPF